ncbi:MAG: acylphosphatase [Lysobacteraceae bacterium]|nr:MAG: acylphosphatase [Xanthomonadaceae bacterium]
MASARFIVRGKVQGVWFRASTRDEALRLGLRGHARNLPTGEVEVLACGDDAAIAMLQRWLHGGPPLARVDAVECLERVDGDIAAPVPLDFSIG